MRILGQTDIQSFDSDNELTFIVTRQRGWADYFVVPLCIGIAVMAWVQGSQVFALLCFICSGAALIINWVQGPSTRLSVTPNQIIADGNLHETFDSKIKILTSEVKSIDYAIGGEHSPSGLYVRHGWSSSCVLPGISREQADSIRDTIARRFPEIGKIDPSPASLLHGDASGITTLGLSKADSNTNS